MIRLLLSLFLISLMAVQCRDDAPDPESDPVTYGGTSSPGDTWDWTIDRLAGNFSASNTEPGYEFTFSGDASVVGSGYLKLTVRSSPFDIMEGESAYALEIPDLALLINPVGSAFVVGAVYKQGCGNIDGTYNFAQIAFAPPYSDAAYGSVVIATDSSGLVSITGTYSLLSGNPGGAVDLTGGTCSDGAVTFSTAKGFVSSNGGLVLDFGRNNGGYVGFKSNDVALTDYASQTYLGLAYSNFGGIGGVIPIQVVLDAAVTGSANRVANLETGELASEVTLTLTLTSAVSGHVSGTLSYGIYSVPIEFAGYESSDGTNILVGSCIILGSSYGVLLVAQ